MSTSTIYVPTPITSAEQAEALPVGTIALLGPERPAAFENAAAVKVGPEETSEGVPLWLVRSQCTAGDAHMVGWTALVPVEVEVEQLRETGGRRRLKTLFVSPWSEDAA
jgi:hypothetical protein